MSQPEMAVGPVTRAPTSEHAPRLIPMAIGVVAAIAVIVVDQISKWLVIKELGPGADTGETTIVPGLVRLIFVRNSGSAFGLFQGGSDLLRIVAIGAIIILVGYYLRTARGSWLVSLALGLVLGGAAGNVIDRFRHGYVVDWIDFPRWPTFNVADSAITVGMALLIFAIVFQPDPATRTATSNSTSADANSAGGDHA